MGSDGFNRILTGFYIFSPVGVRLAPLKRRDFKEFRPDFSRILTRLSPDFNRIPWNLVKICLKERMLDPLLSRPHLPGADLRRVLENAFKKVLRGVLQRRLAMGFTGRKGFEKGS